MGIFGQSSPFDADVEKATSETNTNENWSNILDVCDKVSSNPRNAKDCLKAILKRMGHNDPHVVMQAITLLDACVNNCGKSFHLEIASREFETEFRRLLSKAQPQVSVKMRAVLKSWAENDFRNDPELNLIHGLYVKLRHEGQDFSNLGEKPTKSSAKANIPKDPNVVSSKQEEDDIAKAIELSLKETKSSPKQQASNGNNATSTGSGAGYPSLYPSFSNATAAAGSSNTSPAVTASAPAAQAEARKVRALYDFEAAEENELTFFSGELIHVVDDSDPNWWKGYNQRGEGLFPSNFVTADLSVDPKRLEINQHEKKNVQFNDEINELQQKTDAAIAAAAVANQPIEIDETKIDRLLNLLHEANPEDPTQDSEEMLRLEQEVHQMGPLIDAELERVDRKHAQLTQLSSDLVDAINLYHSLMRDDRSALLGSGGGAGGAMYGMPSIPPGMHLPGSMAGPTSLGYPNAMPNPQTMYGAAGFAGGSIPAGNFPPHMPTQTYGMTTLPYAGNANVPGMPSTTVPTTHNSPMTVANSNDGGYGPTQIPMQFQNGHMNGIGGQHQLNSTLPTVAAMQQQPQLQQHQTPPHTNATNFSVMPHQQQQQQYPQQTTATTIGNDMQQQPAMGVLQSNPMLQQQHQQQFMSPQHNPQQQQQQLSYMPHQPQQQPQYAPIPNGQHTQLSYANMQQTDAALASGASGGMLQQLPTQQQQQPTTTMNNHPSMDQFSQMQQQMAAMSLQMGGGGGGIGVGIAGVNQPITQNFLNQNETKQNIPIYQQQR